MSRCIALVLVSAFFAAQIHGAYSAERAHHPPTRHHDGWVAKNANPKHAWLYTDSGQMDNTIRVYDLQGIFGPKEIGEITDGLDAPAGMAIDEAGTLYVANWNGNQPGGSVTIYPAGATTPSLTLSQGLSVPLDVAVDASGNVWVANRGTSPSIVVYAKGQTLPSQTITSSLITSPAQVQLDSNQNVYFTDSNTGVSEIPYGSAQPVSMGFQGLSLPSGLVVDPRNGRFYVSDYNLRRVYAYEAGNPQPVQTLRPSLCSYMLAAGEVRNAEYIFAPECQAHGTVWIFKNSARRALKSIGLPNGPIVNEVAFKPAGVP